MANKNKVFLYNGSLEELEAREGKGKFDFAKEMQFISKQYRMTEECSQNEFLAKIEEELTNRGYAGLVNMVTHITKINPTKDERIAEVIFENPYPLCTKMGYVEGTPITRLK